MNTTASAVLSAATADPARAVEHFAARLAFETDVADVRHDLESAVEGLVLVDARGTEAWAQGHVPEAVHLPHAEITQRAPQMIPQDAAVVVYCWGPACNGATRAALAFARLGYRVKEMIGGFEYWVREGFPVRTPTGVQTQAPDRLVAPAGPAACGC